MIWTLPNILTVSRIALTPVIALLPFIDGYVPKLIAFGVFLVAAISDFYDGRLARERNEITDLGKLLDPLADKVLLIGVYLTLGSLGQIALWLVILIAFRDLLIIGGKKRSRRPRRNSRAG